MITIKDIAKHAGVAVSTVSYVLNSDPRIPEETRARVLSAAKELGYAGRSGRKSDSEHRKYVIICMHTLEGIILPDIVRCLADVLRNSNCELLVYLGEDIGNLRGMDGLIVLNSKVENDRIAELAKRRVPIVLMDRSENIPDTASVTLDNFNGMYNLTKRVIEKGAKSFVFVGGPANSFESRDRFSGFSQALSESRFGRKDYLYIHSDFTRKGGVKATRFILSGAKIPDAIICANDEMAAGAINMLRSEGYNIPQDIRVTGFDGSITDAYPGFLTVKANHKEWANNAAFSMLQNFKSFSSGKNLKTPVELVEFHNA